MFFYLSKLVGMLIFPPATAFFLIVAALVLLWVNWRRSALLAGVLAAAVLFISIFTPAGFTLILPLENRFERAQLPDRIDGIITLGGGIEGVISARREVVEMANAGDRLYETAILAMKYPDARVVYTGGSGLVFGGYIDSAEIAKTYLVSLGIDPSRITLERKSRNTDENVRFSREIIQPAVGEHWVMVTSAFHMPRSIGLFRRNNWEVLPWPADYRSYGPEAATTFSEDYTSNLETIAAAIREWVGLVSYRLSGRINEIFPGPAE